jgi:hypothetical protein
MYGTKIDERIELYKYMHVYLDFWISMPKWCFQRVLNANLSTASIKGSILQSSEKSLKESIPGSNMK